jgi:hypothetical protein
MMLQQGGGGGMFPGGQFRGTTPSGATIPGR